MSALFGLLGLLGICVGLIMFIYYSIRKKPKKTALVIILTSFASFIIGLSLPSLPKSNSSDNINEAKPVQSASVENNKNDSEIVLETIEKKPKQKDYVSAGTPLEIGKWIVTAGYNEKKVQFAKHLGGGFFTETAEEGYIFALVPISVKNNTKKTETLGLVTWTLEDGEGYSYTVQTLADLCLSTDEVLYTSKVPPEATRAGYIIFQTRENINDLYFGLQISRWNGKWHFKID